LAKIASLISATDHFSNGLKIKKPPIDGAGITNQTRFAISIPLIAGSVVVPVVMFAKRLNGPT